MTEIIIRLQTNQHSIDPDFYSNLIRLAERYGLKIEEKDFTKTNCDFVEPVHETLDFENFVREADAICQRIGPITSDSVEDLREMRDCR